MTEITRTFKHPQDGIAPFRVNVLPAIFDVNTAEVFVGELKSRADDRRGYSWSMVEGGVNKGETPARALMRERIEETGLQKAILLTTARAPLVCYFEDWDTADKYCGKLFLVGAYGIKDRSKVNLFSGKDKQGDTFINARWMPLGEAESWLLAHTKSELRQQLIRETVALLSPVEQALVAFQRHSVNRDLTAKAIHKSLPSNLVSHYAAHEPPDFPLPSRDDPRLRLPSAMRPHIPQDDQRVLAEHYRI